MASTLSLASMDVAAALGWFWIQSRRRRYRRRGRPLSDAESRPMLPYFDPDVLRAVRVCVVPRIEPAVPRSIVRALRLPASVDISMAAGMAFVDAVALGSESRRRVNPEALLFHELVHCIQYRRLGTRRFLRHYLRGWAEAGFDYFAIPLEVQAYALQDRFEAGDNFRVEAEVDAGFQALGYA